MFRQHHSYRRLLTVLILFLLFSPAMVRADQEAPSTFRQALQQGKAFVSLRYRFENVQDHAFDQEANASTLRTTLNYGSAPYRGFSFFLEAENVTTVGNEDGYNNVGAGSLNNGVRDRPVVADPEITEINQAWLELTRGKTDFRVGRQEINLRNHRFVGNVGWRQHHQSFDSLALVNRSLENTTLSYYFVDKVNRIFGDSRNMTTHLLHGEWKAAQKGLLSAYFYELDFDDLATLSTTTYGLRWEGQNQVTWGKLAYVLEAAQQQDAGDNPNRIDVGYYLVEASCGGPALTISAGYEVLEGSPGSGSFRTPLATLHKFNGWADQFLNTPSLGLVDLYGGVGGKAGNVNWKLIYHEFTSDSSSLDYGSELDGLAIWKTNWGQTFGLKVALYEADGFSRDVEKFMLWSSWHFGR